MNVRLAVRAVITGLVVWLLMGSACADDDAPLLPARNNDSGDLPGARLVARFAHVSDSHVIDTESPARYPGAQSVIPSAWRVYENASTQLLDGAIRATNRVHASGRRIDFLLHTGDMVDNSQSNELGWCVQLFDGGQVWPLSGPDDRDAEAIPPPELDPYAPFTAQGLYRNAVHGPLPSIPWYTMVGNHDHLSIGTFPIIRGLDGELVAPLPLDIRPGILIPSVLDPTGCLTHGPISPAHQGPPPLLECPAFVEPVAERHYFLKGQFVEAMFATVAEPPGHGFTAAGGPTWYSTLPVPSLRMICLDTSDTPNAIPGLPYQDGSISRSQRDFLVAELDAAWANGELVIVATHHPSGSLEVLYGSVLSPQEFRDLLNQYPNVIAHVAGHSHRNRVADRGGYIEIETCSTLDWPQEGRLVEVWREADDSVVVSYRMFSAVSDELPPVGEDPLLAIREQAHALADPDKGLENVQRGLELDPNPRGDVLDRDGAWRKP